MSIELISILLFGSFIVLLVTGLPIVFVLGSVAMVATFFLWGPDALYMLPMRAYSVMESFTVIAIPMFIFMGAMLQKSGIADDLYEMMQKWIGGIRGGLAAGTVLICTGFAAMTGVSSTATVTMGMTSLPAMLNRGYNKSIARRLHTGRRCLGNFDSTQCHHGVLCADGSRIHREAIYGGYSARHHAILFFHIVHTHPMRPSAKSLPHRSHAQSGPTGMKSSFL